MSHNQPAAAPTPDQILDQAKALSNFVPAEQHDLLLYLIRILAAGRYERVSPAKPSCRNVVLEYYGFNPAPEQETKQTRSLYARGRSLADDLRESLHKFYRAWREGTLSSLGGGVPNRIVYIEIPDARGYKPLTKWLGPEDQQRLSGMPSVDCRYVGTDDDAMEYQAGILESVKWAWDTAVRSVPHVQSYTPESRERFEEGIRKMLAQSDAEFTSVTGPIVDDDIVQTIRDGAGQAKGTVKCYRLHQTAPLMNFLILDFRDPKRRSEVLFGFGRHHKNPNQEAVYLSDEPGVVAEFRDLFQALLKPQFSRELAGGVSDPEFTEPLAAKVPLPAFMRETVSAEGVKGQRRFWKPYFDRTDGSPVLVGVLARLFFRLDAKPPDEVYVRSKLVNEGRHQASRSDILHELLKQFPSAMDTRQYSSSSEMEGGFALLRNFEKLGIEARGVRTPASELLKHHSSVVFGSGKHDEVNVPRSRDDYRYEIGPDGIHRHESGKEEGELFEEFRDNWKIGLLHVLVSRWRHGAHVCTTIQSNGAAANLGVCEALCSEDSIRIILDIISPERIGLEVPFRVVVARQPRTYEATKVSVWNEAAQKFIAVWPCDPESD